MKIKQLFPAAIMALAALSFTSCDGKDEPDYAPAETPAETQRVYFASRTMNKIVTADATSFDVNVYRPENADAAELTVQLLFTDESNLFSIPEAVTFAAGESFATIPLHYDATAMTPNQTYSVFIAIDEANADEYGESSIQVNINFEQLTDWAPFAYEEGTDKTGLGVFSLGSIFQGNSFEDARVMERHIPSDPANIEFLLQLWDGEDGTEPDVTLPADSELWFNVMTFNTADGGKNITVPLQAFALASGYRLATACTLFPDSFDPVSAWDDVTGTFSLEIMYVDADGGAYNPGIETIAFPGYADTNDYTVSITSAGQVEVDGRDIAVLGFKYDVKAIAHIDYTIVGLQADEEITDEKIEEIAEAIQNPEQTTYTVSTVTKPGNISVSFPTSGTYLVVAVAYNANEEVKSVSSFAFDYETFNPYAGWTEIGNATFDSSLAVGLAAMLDVAFPVESYEVTVSQNDEDPSLYRINNPFANYSYITAFGDPAAFGSIEFVMLDEDHIYFPLSDTDLVLQGDVFSVMSYSYYLLASGQAASPAEIPAELWGTFKDGKITLPALTGDDGFNFLFNLGAEGPYMLNAPFTLDLNAAAPAAAPRKSVKPIRNSIFGMPELSAKALVRPVAFTATWQPAPRASFKQGLRRNPAAPRR